MKKAVLIIGSGHSYNGDNRCFPKEFDMTLIESADITRLDCESSVNPDIIADVTKDGWWNVLGKKFDIIVDTIGEPGPHILHNSYSNIFSFGVMGAQTPNKLYSSSFKTGCLFLLAPGGKFFGHAKI